MSSYVSIEKMKYKKDSLSYSFALLGLILNVCYFFTLYRNNGNDYYNYWMGLSVLYNLIFMLIVFLSAEKIKAYYRIFAIILFIVGCLQIVRIFIYPLRVYKLDALDKETYTRIIIFLSLSSFLLISSSIISFYKSTLLKNFISGKMTFKEQESR